MLCMQLQHSLQHLFLFGIHIMIAAAFCLEGSLASCFRPAVPMPSAAITSKPMCAFHVRPLPPPKLPQLPQPPQIIIIVDVDIPHCDADNGYTSLYVFICVYCT